MDMFSALADPTRREILELLAQKGQLPASDIYEQFSVSHPAISQHLKVLRDNKLVYVEKKAQQRLYQLNMRKIDQLEEWIDHVRQSWSTRLDALDKVLASEKEKLKRQKGGAK